MKSITRAAISPIGLSRFHMTGQAIPMGEWAKVGGANQTDRLDRYRLIDAASAARVYWLLAGQLDRVELEWWLYLF